MPDSPASPCINQCVLDNSSGVCRGCLRTMQEITDWYWLGPTERLAILRRIEAARREASKEGDKKAHP